MFEGDGVGEGEQNTGHWCAWGSGKRVRGVGRWGAQGRVNVVADRNYTAALVHHKAAIEARLGEVIRWRVRSMDQQEKFCPV